MHEEPLLSGAPGLQPPGSTSSMLFSPGGSQALLLGPLATSGQALETETPREVAVERFTMGARQLIREVEAVETGEGGALVSVGTPGRGGGATSPSVASVTSCLSGASAASNTGRRQGLEWDYGSDIGYTRESQHPPSQVAAAALLTPLEKLAIGPYSEYLAQGPRDTHQPLSLQPEGEGEALRQQRVAKFAESLLRQTEEQASGISSLARQVTGDSPESQSPGLGTGAGSGLGVSSSSSAGTVVPCLPLSSPEQAGALARKILLSH